MNWRDNYGNFSREDLVSVLDEFKQAAQNLAGVWESLNGDELGDSYPTHWHSFDEEIFGILGMEVQPEPVEPEEEEEPLTLEEALVYAGIALYDMRLTPPWRVRERLHHWVQARRWSRIAAGLGLLIVRERKEQQR